MSINVDLDRLKSFGAVGEELHFTRAAQNRLHVFAALVEWVCKKPGTKA